MSKINQYEPRVYPKDTPSEARCRKEGFEAGRQFEASLRQENPAVLIPATELADRLARAINSCDESLLHGVVDELRGIEAQKGHLT